MGKFGALTRMRSPPPTMASGSAAGAPETPFQLDEQLAQPGGEFIATGQVETGQHRAFVRQLLGQQPVDQGAPLVGETDMGDPPVTVVAAALDEAAVLRARSRLVTAAPEEKVSRASSPGVSSRSVRRTAPRRSNSARVSPAERSGRPPPAGAGRRSG